MWVIFVVLLAVILFFLYRNTKRPDLYPPGPPFWPYVGNLLTVWSRLGDLKYHHAIWQEWARQYGDVLGLRMGLINLVIVSGRRRIREVASREVFDGRPDGFFYKIRSFGKKLGLVFVDGESWILTRKAVVKYLKNFGIGKQSMECIITEECKALMAMISENVNKPVTINNMFNVSIINVLWQIVAGRRFDLKDDKLKKLCELIKKSFEATDMSGGVLNFLPFIRHVFPNISGYNKLKNINDMLHNFISETIKEHQQSLNVKCPRDVIDALLIEMAEQGEPFTEENVKVISLDLLEAGAETVNNSIVFLILYLVLNDAVTKRVQKEIDGVVGHSRVPALTDRLRMKYTEAVILEALRLSSVAPVGIVHMALDNARLADYIIPKGTFVLLSIYDLHNGEHWEDPKVFNPERFLNMDGDIVTDDWLMPFGMGKRRCIGEGLARSELFLMITHLLQNFSIALPAGDPIPSTKPIDGIALSAKPFRVIFTPRHQGDI